VFSFGTEVDDWRNPESGDLSGNELLDGDVQNPPGKNQLGIRGVNERNNEKTHVLRIEGVGHAPECRRSNGGLLQEDQNSV